MKNFYIIIFCKNHRNLSLPQFPIPVLFHIKYSQTTVFQTGYAFTVTRLTCTYENCECTVDIRRKESSRWKYFKHHVLCRHMHLEICQCNFCGIFIKQVGQNVKANPQVAMFRHNMSKHLPYDFRKWPCNMCDKRFIESPSLRHHIKFEHSGNQFHCFICSSSVYPVYAATSSKAGLRGHLEREHDIVSTTRNPNLRKNRTREITTTTITFDSLKNNAVVQQLLKSHGFEVDIEYPEEKFAMSYNKKLAALLDSKTGEHENEDINTILIT